MKKIKFYALSFSLIAFICLSLVGCNSNDDSEQTSRLSVRMTDAPGDYDAVYIDVQDVLIKSGTDNNDDEGWVSIGDVTPKVYNLLDLTGGVNVLLADEIVPSGFLGQVRLVLGDDNTVVKDGVTYPLKTPSAQQSGLKLKINQTLVGGVMYDFLLDFDVEHSVVKAGNSGNYNLHPVIRVSTMATSGVIKGRISPVLEGFQVLASVQVGTTTTVSAYADEFGAFQLNGIPAGTYDVKLTPAVGSGKAEKTITGVVVVNGEIKDIGSVTLDAIPVP
ncbi:DUF4382 domain-containing protein [Flavobacterium undicola]|uniref:DUF4382 domain-containing protein n=1 Tax=Flavobacterium undicola TaxID=1932779 RepID=UPI0013769B5D|nr:DUF4382 domain-containing protein [Flavobacterium undicola]MBA0883365.1 DUF4382 domain-containing protein [Flavobacterium undicola]